MVERVLLSPDLSGVIFSLLCSAVDPGVAVAFSSASSELWALTHAQRQQLQAEYNVAAALSLKMGMQGCEELREAKTVKMHDRTGLSEDDLATFGTLGSLLTALKELTINPLRLNERAAGLEHGVQRLAEKLGAGALPGLISVHFSRVHVGDAGVSALAAALDRGALPRLKCLRLCYAAIGDAGVVALAPALQRLPALECLDLTGNRLLGDVGAAALVAPPPPPADAPTTMIRALTKLTTLWLNYAQITDTGCAILAAALDSGAVPALKQLYLLGIPASAASKARAIAVLLSRKAMCDA